VARQLVVWNDLVREQAGVWGARVCTLLSGPELRHDAIVSVRRSFTLAEAHMLAEAAGLRDIQVRRVCGARFVLTARPDPDPTALQARPMARAESISFAYGKQRVFSDVSFVARSRELVRITGANGSGKSTLLACVAGALQPAQGTLWVDRTQAPPGYLPQEGGLFAALGGQANLELAASLSGVRPQDQPARIRHTAELLGLQSHLHTPVHQLSGGQRRRVAIACSIVHDPNVLIVDEPDAGLDQVGRTALATVIARVVAKGGTVLAASHTRDWCDRVPGIGRVVEVALRTRWV
jgi:ABC-2 type transport system ATP-binding protein